MLEPGIETVAVYLGLDPREDLLPDIFGYRGPLIRGHDDENLAKDPLIEGLVGLFTEVRDGSASEIKT